MARLWTITQDKCTITLFQTESANQRKLKPILYLLLRSHIISLDNLCLYYNSNDSHLKRSYSLYGIL